MPTRPGRSGSNGRTARVRVSYRRRLTRSGYGSTRYDEGGGDRREALAPPGEAETVAGGRAEADAGSRERSGQRRLGVGAPGPDARRVADDLHGDVPDPEAGPLHPQVGLGQQRGTGRAGPGGVARAEVGAEVTEPRGAEQRVAGGMGRDVAVGVAGQSVDALPQQPRDPALATGFEGVHVDADPHPRQLTVHAGPPRRAAGRAAGSP